MFQVETILMPLPGVAIAAPRSPQWSHERAAWLRDHPACTACGDTTAVEVHHVRPYHLYPERELDPTNFETLCERPGSNCHLNYGHAGNWTHYVPEVRERAAQHLADVVAAAARGSNRLPGE